MRIAIILLFMLTTYTSTFSQEKVEQWKRFELSVEHKASGNPFTSVQLSATFSNKDTTYRVTGFYDGDNRFKIRFMPQATGVWEYKTTSNVKALNNLKGKLECIAPSTGNRGMVKVADTYHFAYSDGERFHPFGTTAYAWTHMSRPIQEETLKSLEAASFNKIRMCVFPKNYNLVKEEPEYYPFEVKKQKTTEKGVVFEWDYDRFNPSFFQLLEQRIDDLNRLGIEADLILFHPYDKGRWGFDAMPNKVNVDYINYLVARLSSFKNVWWSMANEFDYVSHKNKEDWEMLTRAVVKADPFKHLVSIHGSTAMYYDYWKPEITHVSVQDEAPVSDFGRAATVKNIYKKPIVFDEVCYEGNLPSRWGRLSGEEMLHNIWQGVLVGTYVTHGECYLFTGPSDTLFWAKGGKLIGKSWKRIGFTRSIIEALPHPLMLADVSRDHKVATAGENCYLIYFGREMHDVWNFNLPINNGKYPKLKAGVKFKVQIVDTWDMTLRDVPEVFETGKPNDYRVCDKEQKSIRLPYKPYLALLIQEVKEVKEVKMQNK